MKVETERDGKLTVTLVAGTLKVGLLSDLLHGIARHHGLSRDELLARLGY